MSELEMLEAIQDLLERTSDLVAATSLDRENEELTITTYTGAVFDISAAKVHDERAK